MRLRPWRYRFAQHSLEAGEGYFYEERVKDFEWTNDEILAHVQGSELYEVHIDLEDGKVERLRCTCPYAKKGNPCKHEVAVLFEIGKNSDKVDELSDEDIDRIMFEYSDLYEDSVDQEDYYKSEYDYFGHEDEEDNESYFLEVETIDFIENTVNDLLKDHLYKDAIKVVIRTYREAFQYTRNCYESLEEVAQKCCEFMKMIHEITPDDQKHTVKNTITQLLKDSDNDWENENMERIKQRIRPDDFQ